MAKLSFATELISGGANRRNRCFNNDRWASESTDGDMIIVVVIVLLIS